LKNNQETNNKKLVEPMNDEEESKSEQMKEQEEYKSDYLFVWIL